MLPGGNTSWDQTAPTRIQMQQPLGTQPQQQRQMQPQQYPLQQLPYTQNSVEANRQVLESQYNGYQQQQLQHSHLYRSTPRYPPPRYPHNQMMTNRSVSTMNTGTWQNQQQQQQQHQQQQQQQYPHLLQQPALQPQHLQHQAPTLPQSRANLPSFGSVWNSRTPTVASGGASSIGASPTPPQQQVFSHRTSNSHHQSPPGGSVMAQAPSPAEHRHFLCDFVYNGKSAKLESCLSDKCSLLPVNDGGYSQIIANWCFSGQPDVKEVVRDCAMRLINERKHEKDKFFVKMAWLSQQPHGCTTGVRITELAPSHIKVIARLMDMNNRNSVSPTAHGASASAPSISPGVSPQLQQHQQLAQANQAQMYSQLQSVVQQDNANRLAQPHLSEVNFRALQQQLNKERRMLGIPVAALNANANQEPVLPPPPQQQQQQHQLHNQPQMSNSSLNMPQSLPPVPPLKPRPDLATVNNSPEKNSNTTSDDVPTTRVQTVDEWEHYLSSTSMLVIAPEPCAQDISDTLQRTLSSKPGNQKGFSNTDKTSDTCEPEPEEQSFSKTDEVDSLHVSPNTHLPLANTSKDTNNMPVSTQPSSQPHNSLPTSLSTSATSLNSPVSKLDSTRATSSSIIGTCRMLEPNNNIGNSSNSVPQIPKESEQPEQKEQKVFPAFHHIPQGNGPEYISLDLMSGIPLTPEIPLLPSLEKSMIAGTQHDIKDERLVGNSAKVKADNKEQKKRGRPPGKRGRKKSIKDSNTNKATTVNKTPKEKNWIIVDTCPEDSSDDEIHHKKKKRRRIDSEDEDYVPDRPLNQQYSSYTDSSDDTESYYDSSLSSEDSLLENDLKDFLPRRYKRRRKRRAYISDRCWNSATDSSPPDLEIRVHRLSEENITTINRHIRKGKFKSVKYSLHCRKCKLIRNVGKLFKKHNSVYNEKEEVVQNTVDSVDGDTIVTSPNSVEENSREGNSESGVRQDSNVTENPKYCTDSAETNSTQKERNCSSKLEQNTMEPDKDEPIQTTEQNKISIDDYKPDELYAEFLQRNDVFACNCKMIYMDKVSYHIHKNTHTLDNILACGVCRKEFDSTLGLHVHLLDMACVGAGNHNTS